MDLEARIDELEQRLEDALRAITLLVSGLPDGVREVLTAAMAAQNQQLHPVRPPDAGEWSDPEMRRLAAAVELIEEGLLDAAPGEA